MCRLAAADVLLPAGQASGAGQQILPWKEGWAAQLFVHSVQSRGREENVYKDVGRGV